MIRLLSFVIVAGLLFESPQQAVGMRRRHQKRPGLTRPVFPEKPGPGLTRPVFPEKPGQGLTRPVFPGKKGPGLTRPLLHVKKGWPCYYPTHIKCWTDWFDRDDPSGTGDSETLYNLRKENPGKICPKPVDIEAQTLSGLSVAAAGDVNTQLDPAVGFICKNQDQPEKKCNDYRVRFSCHPPFCGGGVCWTKWYDHDDPSETGDSELLSDLKKENPGEICDYPLYIEAVTTDTLTPAISTWEIFHVYNPTQGFDCRNKDQKSGECRDYKVRFGCPCKD